MSRYNRVSIVIILLILLSLTAPALHAQQAIQYGSAVTGTLAADAPVQVYSFSGATGDLMTVSIMPLTPGLQPTVSLVAPSGQPLPAQSLIVGGVLQLNAQLTGDGVYTMIISGGVGEFALTLAGQPAAAAVEVSPGGSDVPLAAEQVFTVPAAGAARVLTLTTNPPTTITATLRGGDTGLFAVQSGGAPLSFTVPAGATPYTLSVSAPAGAAGVLSVALADAGAPPPDVVTPPPATAEATSPPFAACTVAALASSGVNVRSGPGTEYPVIAALTGGTAAPAVGENNGWYVVELPGGIQGWVASSVVTAAGDCDNLPVIAPPPAGATATYTPTYTPTVADQTGATAIFTPSYTPTVADQTGATATMTPTIADQTGATATATPSYTPTAADMLNPTATFTPSYTPTTPPAAQIAPEDARFNNPLTIPLDNTASVLDFVSYPDGDNEDRVRWEVTGLGGAPSSSTGQANLTITASCFGEGTENIEFFASGQTFGCGSTIVDRVVSADSRTGSITITAVGGDATYVQWVLTGTATRIN